MNIEPLYTVAAFLYLARTVAYNNIDWAELYQNIQKARRWWVMVGKVVTKTGETVRARGMLYNAVVKLVLLNGSDNWVVMKDMLKVLEGFHHWSERRITRMAVRRTSIG